MSEAHTTPLSEYTSPELELVWSAPPQERPTREAVVPPYELLFPRLPKALFGYRRSATDAALERLAGELRWLEQECQEARERAHTLELQVGRLDEREWAIAKTMTLAAETA